MFILQDSDGSLWGGTLGFGLEKFNPQDNVAVHYQHDPDDPNSLGEDTIYDPHRDPQDRIWIGTARGGLSIFEPTENQFKNYPPDPDDPNAISNASVHVIYQADDGVAWLGAMGGGRIFLRRAERAEQLLPGSDRPETFSPPCAYY